MMTLHKLHAGDGYTYLTRQVAAGDEGRSPGQKLADYYTASGNPPGRWVGSGAKDLAVTGRVREDQMRALFGQGMHPDADQIIAFELAAGHTQADAERAAKLGRAFPNYTPLPPRAERVTQRVTTFADEYGRPPTSSERSRIEAEEARRDRRAVAGYDLVFTPVKSASLLWALGSATTREQVEAAHHEAVADTLAWLERETGFARIGSAGEAQIETRGFVAAAFDHRDSRAGDPDLHTHVAISNKVRAREDHADGRPRWLSLDARVIHAAAVAASERYNTRLEEAMSRRLGVEFTERADSIRRDKRSVREVAGVPVALIKHFSRRRAAIEDRYRELASDYRHSHGHEPPREAQLKLAQQATLETRDRKAAPASLAGQITGWREEAAAVLGDHELADLEHQTLNRQGSTTTIADLPVDDLAATVLSVVSEEKATWTRWNLIAETERQLRPYRFPTNADRDAATDAVVARATDPQLSVQLTPADVDIAVTVEQEHAASTPLRRSNGESVFTEHGAVRFTTRDILDAEQRLLETATQRTRYGLTTDAVTEMIGAFEKRYDLTLDEGQRALVLGFAADPRRIVVGIGPAGAGKTTAMRAVAEAWRTTGRRVVPLAPSAAAAEVLGAELGCRAENLHKFQHAHTDAQSVDDWFRLQPGDLVLIDEAGMAGTRRLDWVVRYARERGAVVRLLGDPSQMSAVEAGGALRLLVNDVGAVQLNDLHRFTDPAEAEATLQLREGRAEALDFYFDRDRVAHGTSEAMLEDSYEAWATDTRQGRTSLLIASAGRDVSALNARARFERIAAGDVTVDGVELHDGNRAGVGDRIVTRVNDRGLTTRGGRDFVKNGDVWAVEGRHRNGDLTVRHGRHSGRVRLPSGYVAESVELAYATTTARAQGMTVDTAHVLVDTNTSRESLYVAATRGRLGARLYVASEDLIGIDAERPPAPALGTRDVLAEVLHRESSERSATEVQREATTRAAQRRRASESFLRGGAGRRPDYIETVNRVLGEGLADAVIHDAAFRTLSKTLARLEAAGHDPGRMLRRAAQRHELDTAASVAKVLNHRIEVMTAMAGRAPSAPLAVRPPPTPTHGPALRT
ncbi:MobF family relaxase [Nocardioides mesophilus]|nr:MobF family relaxase [Nocardioides mesophilus]